LLALLHFLLVSLLIFLSLILVSLLIFLSEVLPDLSDDCDYYASPDCNEATDNRRSEGSKCNPSCMIVLPFFYRQSGRLCTFQRRLFQFFCPVLLCRKRLNTEIDRIAEL
jgi:hypothetical protein